MTSSACNLRVLLVHITGKIQTLDNNEGFKDRTFYSGYLLLPGANGSSSEFKNKVGIATFSNGAESKLAAL